MKDFDIKTYRGLRLLLARWRERIHYKRALKKELYTEYFKS